MTLRETLRRAKIAILDDGKVTLGETTVLLRMIRPFLSEGNPGAVELEALLKRVRQDGVITPEESMQIAETLQTFSMIELSLNKYIHKIKDFPREGNCFYDITGIFESVEGFNMALEMAMKMLEGFDFDLVVAQGIYGSIFASALASRYGKAFAPIRVAGRLPRKAASVEYEREGGKLAKLELHTDAINPGERVLLINDVLATGRTIAATAKLVELVGGKVAKILVPVELESLGARKTLLSKYDVAALIRQK